MKPSLLSVITAATLVAAFPSNLSAQPATPPPQISLSGSAEVKVAPDEIILNVAVETRATTLEPARLENEQKIAASLAFLRANKIKDKDLKTDYISVQPQFNPRNNDNDSHVIPVGYIVRKNLEVRLTDLANFQNVLTGLLTNGVNYVNSVDFRTTQLRKFRDQARSLAVRAAKEKAEALTNELGAKLGKVSSISAYDNGGVYSSSFNGRFNGGFNNYVQNSSVVSPSGGGSDRSDETFAVGLISVSATVNVSFLIE
jgi:uncharacterized protein YggE